MPHLLNWNGRAIVPDIAILDQSGYTVTADTTNITITRTTGPAAVNVLVESWHSIERAFGAKQTVALTPRPLVIQGSTGGGGGGPLLNIPTETFINLIGVNNDVDLWSGGPRTTRVEVDLVGGSGATITGITAGQEGDVLLLWNGGGGAIPDTLTIVNQSALSAPANRLWVADGKDINIANNNGVMLVYVGDSWTTFAGETTMIRAQELSLDPATQPAALANGSTTNDYNPWSTPPFTSYVRQDTGLASTITGIVAAGAPNSEGRILVFQNISATGSITVKHSDPGSNPDNRIICPDNMDVVIGPQASMLLIYDDTVAMWRVIGNKGGSNFFVPMTNGEAFDMPIGTPVYCSAPNTFKMAKADTPNTANIIGLVADVVVPSGAIGNVQLYNVLSATAAQWDAVAGTSGGLQFNTHYYLSPTTAGQLTATAPNTTGQFVTKAGIGISPTQMVVRPEGLGAATNARFMFALWGQSNAFGQQSTINILNDQRANIGVAYANINFRQKSSQPAAANPIVWTTDSTGSLSSYTSTQNNNSGHGIDGTGLGPAQSLGRHMDFYRPNKNDISCVGVSGSSLAVHWNPTGAYPAGGPNLYNQALSITNAAMGTFGSTINGFFWVQGETDAQDATDAGNYQANLTAFFNAVRVAYGSTVPIVFAQLSVHSSLPFANTVRAAQATVAGVFTNCTMVVTDDVPLGGDGVHYTADGYTALGDRMAAAMLTLLGVASPLSWTVDPFSLIGIPQTLAEWNAVLAAAGRPAIAVGDVSLYLLQEAAGNLSDSISGITLVPSGAGVTYQLPLADWNRVALEFSEGGNAVFSSTDPGLPDPATTSQTRFLYTTMFAAPSAQNMYLWGTAGFSAIARNAGGGGTEWQLSDGGNTVVGATSVTDTIRPFVELRAVNGLGSPRVDAYTSNAHISGVFGVVTGKKTEIGCEFGTPHFTPFYCVDFFGVAAEFITADIRTILQLLNWGNANLGAVPIPW